MCGAKIPQPLLLRLEARGGRMPRPSTQAGVDYAVAAVPATCWPTAWTVLHFYTLNKSKATVSICQALPSLRGA